MDRGSQGEILKGEPDDPHEIDWVPPRVKTHGLQAQIKRRTPTPRTFDRQALVEKQSPPRRTTTLLKLGRSRRKDHGADTASQTSKVQLELSGGAPVKGE